jgi:sugar lactone lactonase YvrE
MISRGFSSQTVARCWRASSVLLILTLFLGSTYSARAAQPGNDAFQRTWQRTDQAVLDGLVARTWMWGPQANTEIVQEPYAEAPNGVREVQYYDKARMEITDPDGDSGSIWYVTNGLLVVELITGKMQTGDATFEDRNPGQVNVAGDFDDPTGPTYATFASLLESPARMPGSTLTERVDRAAAITNDPSLAGQGVTVAIVDEVTNHAIAAPFWSFMTSSGTIYENGQFISNQLFENPYFATGRPITEAYWANVKVGGNYQDVLMQCFERRCLTYTPGNPEGFIVEAGNVGQHYYSWRYADESPDPAPDPTPDPTPDPAPEPATRYDFQSTWGLAAKGVELTDPAAVATAPSGDIYVTDSWTNRVVRFAPNGEFITAWGSTGNGPGQFSSPNGIDVDENGNVYVADTGNDRVQKFDANGAFITSWGGVGNEQGKLITPSGLAIGPDDIVYVSDAGNNRIQRFTLGGAFGGMWGSQGNGPGQFNTPNGVAIGPSGLIYVADTGNHRVQIFDGAGNPQGGFGQAGTGEGQFNYPLGLTVSGNGAVYVSDLGHDLVQIFTVAQVIAPAESRALASVQYEYAGTLGEPGQLIDPVGLGFDSYGRVLVADPGNNRVQFFASSGLPLRGGMKLVDTWLDDSRGTFRSMNELALGHDGRVYIVDAGLDEPGFELAQIQIFNPNGVYIDQWRDLFASGLTVDSQGNLLTFNNTTGHIEKYSPDGQLLNGGGPGDGQARVIAARLDLAVDGQDNLYILNTFLGNIQKYSPDGVYLDSWGAPGSQSGQLLGATGIAIHGDEIYVADKGNHRVQVFDLNGSFLREWGSLGSGDGQFNEPHGIAVDADGYVYVTDSKNNRVQKFSAEGEYVAKWGSEGTINGRFRSPEGIALDAAGNVYVADTGNLRVQKFAPVS